MRDWKALTKCATSGLVATTKELLPLVLVGATGFCASISQKKPFTFKPRTVMLIIILCAINQVLAQEDQVALEPKIRLPIENKKFGFCGKIDGFENDFTELKNELSFEEKPASNEQKDKKDENDDDYE